LIFKINQIILKAKKRIKKQVIIIGNGKVDNIINKKAIVERKRIEDIEELHQYQYIHEIIISEKINAKENLDFLLYLAKIHNTQIYFSSSLYMAILREKLNGENSLDFLSTFIGRKTDLDELLIRTTDLFGSLIFLLVFSPVMLFISLLIETTSAGPVLYKQERVGKDGKTFIIYKFRTMKNDTDKQSEPESAKKDDPRVTAVGKLLRPTRLDELPQLFNVLKGNMSLVGPRPENLSRVEKHAALRGIRLAVKPGLTGLAQIRSFYDIEPKHKIKYDYLYIQRRSLALNFYILLQTVPVVLTKKGW
jgi:lipopolysaccharide/colanic/teichoic acid biosynthesis glycosyltransferase